MKPFIAFFVFFGFVLTANPCRADMPGVIWGLPDTSQPWTLTGSETANLFAPSANNISLANMTVPPPVLPAPAPSFWANPADDAERNRLQQQLFQQHSEFIPIGGSNWGVASSGTATLPLAWPPGPTPSIFTPGGWTSGIPSDEGGPINFGPSALPSPAANFAPSSLPQISLPTISVSPTMSFEQAKSQFSNLWSNTVAPSIDLGIIKMGDIQGALSELQK